MTISLHEAVLAGRSKMTGEVRCRTECRTERTVPRRVTRCTAGGSLELAQQPPHGLAGVRFPTLSAHAVCANCFTALTVQCHDKQSVYM